MPMLYLNKIIKIISSSFRKPYYGFIQGHDYIKEHDIKYIKQFLERASGRVVDEFEKRFASIVGDGQAVSFASGRMGFYALMKVLGIGPGDEIILQGSTCVEPTASAESSKRKMFLFLHNSAILSILHGIPNEC